MDTLRPFTPSQQRLLLATPLVVLVLFGLSRIIAQHYSGLHAFVLIMGLYWSALLVLSSITWNSTLAHLYSNGFSHKHWAWLLALLIPAAALVAILLQAPPLLSPGVWGLVIGTALINGVVEELFWRGSFIANALQRLWLAWLYPSLWFTLWHTALLDIPGLTFQGGAPALMGGALATGLVWGWVAWRTHDLRLITLAHVLTNTIAFASLARDNVSTF